MSAISLLPTNEPVAEAAESEELRPTGSLVEAVDEYAKARQELIYLQRASARMILDALDKHFPPSQERTQVRQRVLDTLAYYRKEVDRWASSLQAESSATPSKNSTD